MASWHELGSWFAELRINGKAPDYQAELTFAKEVRSLLRTILDAIEPKVFRRFEDKPHGIDFYICEDDYTEWIAAFTGERPKHFFCFNLITLEPDRITFFRAGGGHMLRDYLEWEMQAIDAILHDDRLPLIHWLIENAGNGTFGGLKKEGRTKPELRNYLRYLASLED